MPLNLEGIKDQVISYNPFVLIGQGVNLHPAGKLESFANQVSAELTKYPYKMLQYNPKQILDAMKSEKAVVVTDPGGEDLLGFAQIWKYGVNNQGQTIQELGSWLAFENGIGRFALMGGMMLGVKNPEDQIIAIVEQDNTKAQKVIRSFGGVELGGHFSPVIKTVEDEPAWMKKFDITLTKADLDAIYGTGSYQRIKRAIVVLGGSQVDGPVKVVGPGQKIETSSGPVWQLRNYGKYLDPTDSSLVFVNEVYSTAGVRAKVNG